MFYLPRLISISLLFLLILVPASEILGQPIPVEVVQNENGDWQLLRGGKPYFVKGAGGDGPKELLAASGANTFRTWGVGENLENQLDEAHELGLAVIVGHWLGHERHGFDYDNSEMLTEQFERIKADVLTYKDHPAVLMWSVGNEMEGFAEGDNPIIWNHVQEIAAMIKELDPHHPIMTVTAEIGGERIQSINELTPDIDIHGINSYGGFPSLIQRYRDSGGKKPIIITEFGPPGTWEVGRTSFEAPPELTSTQKAEIYASAFQNGCLAYPDLCLGGLAFTWGSKMEATATWFGMFLPTGEKLAAVDAMTEIWSGNQPENLSPAINRFELIGSDRVLPGDQMEVILDVYDPEDDELKLEWVVRGEVTTYFTGGDVQGVPFELDVDFTRSSEAGAALIAPSAGIYRLYLTVYDQSGAAAVANILFQVEGEPSNPPLKLPVKVYADDAPQPWFPSGWMGNTDKLEVDLESEESPRSGSTSIKIKYTAFDNWVGVAWQHPINDWGDQQGGYNLHGASKLTFWARGNTGGERVNFGVGILKEDRDFFDTAFAELENVKLSDKWKKYTIDLKGKDLSRIKTPFAWSLGSPGFPVTFFLDDIQFE